MFLMKGYSFCMHMHAHMHTPVPVLDQTADVPGCQCIYGGGMQAGVDFHNESHHCEVVGNLC